MPIQAETQQALTLRLGGGSCLLLKITIIIARIEESVMVNLLLVNI